MVFKIRNTQWSKSLLDNYPILHNYGYHNEHNDNWGATVGYIMINSPEELVDLSNDLHEPIIISQDGNEPEIEIYDDFRE